MFRFQQSFTRSYVNSSTWRKIFLIYENKIHKTKEKIIFDRMSTIPIAFLGVKVSIYNGYSLKKKVINRWVVGFKFGELTWNRKLALYKAKQLKKKKK